MLKMQVLGHLGSDATTRDVEGNRVINFSIADSYKLKDGSERTTWIDCSFWSESKVADYLKKGQQVFVEGTPGTRTYAAKDGTTKAVLQLTVSNIHLAGAAPKKEEAAQPAAQQPQQRTDVVSPELQALKDAAAGAPQSDELPM